MPATRKEPIMKTKKQDNTPMLLRVAIVEDVLDEASVLRNYVERYCSSIGVDVSVDVYSSSTDFIESFSKQYQILFLDIELLPHEDNGMDLAHEIREKDDDCAIVFVTNLSRYAIEGYQVKAIDYILKPINYDIFSFRFDSIIKPFLTKDTRSIVIKSRGAYHKLRIQDIYYLCVINHICYFYGTFSSGDDERHLTSHECWMQLSAAEKEINSSHFVKCSPSYLINIDHVSQILKDSLLVGSTSLPLSRNKKKSVVAAYMNSFGSERP